MFYYVLPLCGCPLACLLHSPASAPPLSLFLPFSASLSCPPRSPSRLPALRVCSAFSFSGVSFSCPCPSFSRGCFPSVRRLRHLALFLGFFFFCLCFLCSCFFSCLPRFLSFFSLPFRGEAAAAPASPSPSSILLFAYFCFFSFALSLRCLSPPFLFYFPPLLFSSFLSAFTCCLRFLRFVLAFPLFFLSVPLRLPRFFPRSPFGVFCVRSSFLRLPLCVLVSLFCVLRLPRPLFLCLLVPSGAPTPPAGPRPLFTAASLSSPRLSNYRNDMVRLIPLVANAKTILFQKQKQQF